MVELSSALVTTMIGMLGVVTGAIISNYVNQRIAAKSVRRDIVFKKKIEYFEKIVESINFNRKMYESALKQAVKDSGKSQISKIISDLKKNRKKFILTSIPLYLDVTLISKRIRYFVSIEKKIFHSFEMMKDSDEQEEIIDNIRHAVKLLESIGEKMIIEMRKELKRD